MFVFCCSFFHFSIQLFLQFFFDFCFFKNVFYILICLCTTYFYRCFWAFSGVHYKTMPRHTDMPNKVIKLVTEGLATNAGYTSRILKSQTPGELPKQVGNKTECALLGFIDAIGTELREDPRRTPGRAPAQGLHVQLGPQVHVDRASASWRVGLPRAHQRSFRMGDEEVLVRILELSSMCSSLSCIIYPYDLNLFKNLTEIFEI